LDGCNDIEYENNNEMWAKFERINNIEFAMSRLVSHIRKYFGNITRFSTDEGVLFQEQTGKPLKKEVQIIRINFTMSNILQSGCAGCISDTGC
jgi:hypothetical protein